MNSIINGAKDGIFTLLQDHQKVCLSFLIPQVDRKLVEQLSQSLHVNILYPTVQHQVEKVVNHFGVLPQEQIRFKTFWLENLEVFTLCSAHCINHLFSYLYRRRVWLRISSQDESEVDMEHLAVRRDQEVLQVSVANPKKIGDRTISRTAENIIFHD